MSSEDQLYSQDDAEAILSIASRQINRESINRAQLLQTASELGITPQALAAAEAEYAAKRLQDEHAREENMLRADHQRMKNAALLSHVVAYFFLNAALVAIFFAFDRNDFFWPLLCILGWGVGLSSHAIVHYSKVGSEAEFQKWLLKKRSVEAAQRYWRDRVLTPQGHGQNLVAEICKSGQLSKLEAIQRYREATGADQMAAKQVVEDFEMRHPGLLS